MAPRVAFTTQQQWLTPGLSPESFCGALRRQHPHTVHLNGAGEFSESWSPGSLVAVTPEPLLVCSANRDEDAVTALSDLDKVLRKRRATGGTADTGIAVLLGYEFPLNGSHRQSCPALIPNLAALQVDRSVRFGRSGDALLTVRFPDDIPQTRRQKELTNLQAQLDALVAPPPGVQLPALPCSPRTSLPREKYLQTVQRVLDHIALGDIYQANLCQQFSSEFHGDPYQLYCKLGTVSPAPHSAYFQIGGLSVASVSPERFIRQYDGRTLETYPIKGTAQRSLDPGKDQEASTALLNSEKDRAELLMIVDLERNDLGRICRTGSVQVTELAALRSYATVHHLVARIEGQLQEGIGLTQLIEATFPGGSITGAPKRRAMEILAELEPVPRNFFSGCLFWFGDDGSMDSSILIRSLVISNAQVMIGAGGGIVSDSDPEKEWLEANHKARPLTTLLGFDPEEAE
jgi:anthranilate/para-aminobenzoate synthase component I